jgi:hypothetical protein
VIDLGVGDHGVTGDGLINGGRSLLGLMAIKNITEIE